MHANGIKLIKNKYKYVAGLNEPRLIKAKIEKKILWKKFLPDVMSSCDFIFIVIK